MYREPKLPHDLCGLSFREACHFVRPIPVCVFPHLEKYFNFGFEERNSLRIYGPIIYLVA